MPQKYPVDYRVNMQNGQILSVEVTCCQRRIGEIRFKDGQSIKCPGCGTIHLVRLQHNHFHLSQENPRVSSTKT
ncbi:MAG: hypothetical protein AB1523_02750 [Bacillota bacterium]